MADRLDADLFREIVVQHRKGVPVNVVLREPFGVLPKPDRVEPVCNVIHTQPYHFEL